MRLSRRLKETFPYLINWSASPVNKLRRLNSITLEDSDSRDGSRYQFRNGQPPLLLTHFRHGGISFAGCPVFIPRAPRLTFSFIAIIGHADGG